LLGLKYAAVDLAETCKPVKPIAAPNHTGLFSETVTLIQYVGLNPGTGGLEFPAATKTVLVW
jgi:hypothetical protein